MKNKIETVDDYKALGAGIDETMNKCGGKQYQVAENDPVIPATLKQAEKHRLQQENSVGEQAGRTAVPLSRKDQLPQLRMLCQANGQFNSICLHAPDSRWPFSGDEENS